MPFEAIAVCGRGELDRVVKSTAATHVVSVLHPADQVRLPQEIARRNHLRVDMDDTDDIRAPHAPVASHVIEVSSWCAELPECSRLVVHCLAGISRSPAMALGLLAEVHDPDRATHLLRRICRKATPNPRLVAL
jgi:predicted protein tyrosine phosphatase